MQSLSHYLKSRNIGHLDYTLWKPEEKTRYLRYVPRNVRTILDVGCGMGEFVWVLINEGFEVDGCDTDKVCIEKSKKVLRKAKYADVQRLSRYYAGDSFDLVTCLHVLEHVRYPYMALRELGAVTRKYVLCAVPNARYVAYDERDTHLYSWNERTFKNMLEDAGFEILMSSNDSMNIFPNILRLAPILNRILGRIFWGPMELVTLVRKKRSFRSKDS